MERDKRLVVGAVVSTFASRASWSLHPRTTSRAFARGLPSGFLLHLSGSVFDMGKLPDTILQEALEFLDLGLHELLAFHHRQASLVEL